MPDCIVVGGGIIGLLTARQLHLEGVDVLLLEKGKLGGESSWAGGGIISPLYPWHYEESVNVLAQRSKEKYPKLAQELLEETGIDCELLTSGLFTVTENKKIIHDWSKKWSVNARYIDDAKSIHEIESTVGDVVDQGIWMPDVMQVRNPKLVEALKASCKKQAIKFKEEASVDEILIKDGRVNGVRIYNKSIYADKVIVASGAWSAQFSATKNSVEVKPVKGQMIMYKGAPNLVERIVLSEGHYIIPRKDGRILAGSTLEKIGFDKTTSSDALDELNRSAVKLVPLLANLDIERQWAGLRPGTEKGVPYICQHDAVENLFVHAGHFRNGIVLGLASAELMVDVVMQRAPWCDVSPYGMGDPH